MFQMRKFLTVILPVVVAVVGLMAATPAQADFYTSKSTIDVNGETPGGTPVGPPVINGIQVVEGGGRLFTNSYAVTVDGVVLVRTVGAVLIDQIIRDPGSNVNDVEGPGSSTTTLLVAFAIDGHTISATEALFTSGGFGIWIAGEFDSDDPTTWFDDFSNPLYKAVLVDGQDIIVGDGDTLGGNSPGDVVFTASEVNVSAANSGSPGALAQGKFLFYEEDDPVPDDYDDQNGTSDQTEFLDVSGAAIEAIFSIVNQTFGSAALSSSLLNADTPGGGTAAAKQAVINAIAAYFGLSLLDDGGGNTGNFAAFGAGAGNALDYRPTGSGVNSPGDFSATISVQSYPGAVPEPSSLVLLSVGSLVGGLYHRNRRKKAA
jgi:hypothetical protein